MQNKHRFLFFSLAGILAALLLSAATVPASGDWPARPGLNKTRSSQSMSVLSQAGDGFNCLAILREVANRAGLKGDERSATDYTDSGANFTHCDLQLEKEIDERSTTSYFYYYSARLIIMSSPDDPEEMSGGDLQRTKMTFHGFPALLETSDPGEKSSKAFHWYIPDHKLIFYLNVFAYEFYSDSHGATQTTYLTPDWMQVAETFYAVTYNRLPELNLPPPDPNQILPVDPGEVIPGQPGAPTDQTVPTDTGGIFGIPLAVILGSLGIPVAGALAGAVVSSLVSLLGSSSPIPVAVPEPDTGNVQGLYWSERPWDVAGPGYVSKAEYEQTKNMLEQGYKWTNGGWQTPDQISEINQLQQNNQNAVAREDEQFLKELEKNKQRETPQKDLRTFDMRLGDFQEDLYALRDELEKTNYVLNPWQGDPTILIHKGITIKNMAYDATIGQFTGEQGLTCQDYVQKTSNKSNDYLQKHFPGATVESMIFEERSSQANAKGFMNWLDSRIDDNHNLLRVALPDGSQLAVDFHQNRAGKAPLIRKWDEARKVWRDYLGEKEFMERTSYTLGGN